MARASWRRCPLSASALRPRLRRRRPGSPRKARKRSRPGRSCDYWRTPRQYPGRSYGPFYTVKKRNYYTSALRGFAIRGHVPCGHARGRRLAIGTCRQLNRPGAATPSRCPSKGFPIRSPRSPRSAKLPHAISSISSRLASSVSPRICSFVLCEIAICRGDAEESVRMGYAHGFLASLQVLHLLRVQTQDQRRQAAVDEHANAQQRHAGLLVPAAT